MSSVPPSTSGAPAAPVAAADNEIVPVEVIIANDHHAGPVGAVLGNPSGMGAAQLAVNGVGAGTANGAGASNSGGGGGAAAGGQGGGGFWDAVDALGPPALHFPDGMALFGEAFAHAEAGGGNEMLNQAILQALTNGINFQGQVDGEAPHVVQVFNLEPLEGEPMLHNYCSVPYIALANAALPMVQTELTLHASDLPIAVCILVEQGNRFVEVRGVYVSWRCTQLTGQNIAVGWYIPMEAGRRFQIRVLNFRYPGHMYIRNAVLNEVEDEICPDVRLEGNTLTGARGPGVDARHYFSLPRVVPGVLRSYVHPQPGNLNDGCDIVLDQYKGEVGDDVVEHNLEAVYLGSVRIHVRTPRWLQKHEVNDRDWAPWFPPAGHPKRNLFSCLGKRPRVGQGPDLSVKWDMDSPMTATTPAATH